MTTQSDVRLKEISEQLKNGTKPNSVTARNFISWFGAQRRSTWNVIIIRSALGRYGLVTKPDFQHTYIDSSIDFSFAPAKDSVVTEEELITDVEQDPTYRIGKLESANNTPVSVTPDDEVAKAVTLMIYHDYSQLPVMTSDRDVKGIISWKSLGRQLTLGKECQFVRQCMAAHKEIVSDTSIFSAVDDIIANEYVLIRNSEQLISGIVTTSDLGLQFRQLGEPFLLIGEIENYVRKMIADRYTEEELKAACNPSDPSRMISSPSDLTFGEYLRLIENPDNWGKLAINVDRTIFTAKLDGVRRIRNEVMHFDPDGISDDDVGQLRDFARLMQSLAKVGAI